MHIGGERGGGGVCILGGVVQGIVGGGEGEGD